MIKYVKGQPVTDVTPITRKAVLEIIDRHADKARQSAYDADVCVLAVAAARDVVGEVPDGGDFLDGVVKRLSELAAGYNDTDGEYTSGRGVIVAVLDDVYGLRAG